MRNGATGISIVLIALGGILTWAVETETEGLNINTVGIILMIAGAIGLVVTLLALGADRGPVVRERRTVDRDVPHV